LAIVENNRRKEDKTPVAHPNFPQSLLAFTTLVGQVPGAIDTPYFLFKVRELICLIPSAMK